MMRTIIDRCHLGNHAFLDAWPVQVRQEMRQDQGFRPRLLGRLGNIEMRAGHDPVFLVQLGTRQEVVHVNEDIAVARELDEWFVDAAVVTGIDEAAGIGLQPVSLAIEVGLHVTGGPRRDAPTIAANRIARRNLVKIQGGTRAGALPTSRRIDGKARRTLRPCGDVESECAPLADKAFGDLTQRRRAVDLQLRGLAIAMVPAGQHHPRIVHHMVVVIVREEQMRDVGCLVAGFKKPMVRARSVIDDDHIAARIEEIAGALAAQGRSRRSGPEQE